MRQHPRPDPARRRQDRARHRAVPVRVPDALAGRRGQGGGRGRLPGHRGGAGLGRGPALRGAAGRPRLPGDRQRGPRLLPRHAGGRARGRLHPAGRPGRLAQRGRRRRDRPGRGPPPRMDRARRAEAQRSAHPTRRRASRFLLLSADGGRRGTARRFDDLLFVSPLRGRSPAFTGRAWSAEILGSVAAEYLDHPRPLAFAHRGGAARQPENTLARLRERRAARLRLPGDRRAVDRGRRS